MKRILRVLTCAGGFGKKEKEADQPEENKIEKSTAAAAPIDASSSEVAAENGEHKSSNSSFEIIETNDPALVENKEENKSENDETDTLESKKEEKEKESTAVFKNVANTIEEKPVPVAEEVPEPEKETSAAPVEAEKVEAQTQAEPKVVQSSALPAELAEEAADLQKMTVAEEKISIAEEVKTLPKEEPLNFAKALKTPPVEEKIVEKVVEEEKKVENVKLDDLENEEEDSGNVSEEKSAEESLEKIQTISDECEKAVKRTSTEIEALRAEILRNILIAKELENEKEPASDEKLDIPAENPETLNASQTTNANTPNKKSKKRKHKMQKPKHQKW